jgi:transcription elongation factor S-II
MAFSTKEVELKGRALNKAVAGGDHSSTILSILDELRRGVSASAELLRNTKIGMIVNKLRQHKDPIVAKMASELVKKWRSDVSKRTNGSEASTPKALSGDAAAGDAKKRAENGTKKGVDKWKSSVALEKRNSKTDGVDTSGTTKSETRDSCVKLMYDGLAFLAEEGTCRLRL